MLKEFDITSSYVMRALLLVTVENSTPYNNSDNGLSTRISNIERKRKNPQNQTKGSAITC